MPDNLPVDVTDPSVAERVRRSFRPLHFRRLRHHIRSGHRSLNNDPIDTDLVAAGCLDIVPGTFGASIRVTALGHTILAERRLDVRQARQPHEDLISVFIEHGMDPRRLAVRGCELPLEEPVGRKFVARPDVFSLVKTLNPANWAPVTYEVKVSRADALADIRAGKWRCYLPFSKSVVFIAPDGILTPKDMPAECGLTVRREDSFVVLKRPKQNRNWHVSPRQLMKLVLFQSRHDDDRLIIEN